MQNPLSTSSGLPPTNSRPAIIFGLAIIFGGVASFGAWASLATLSSAVIGNGIVKVESNRKKVQSLDGGIIRSIEIANGQSVKSGDMLVKLDDTRERASLAVIQSRYDLVQATVARLEAEQSGVAEIKFPGELLAKADSADVADLIEGQRQLFEVRRQAQAGQVNLIRKQIVQLNEQSRGLVARSNSEGEQILISENERDGLAKLLKKGLISKSRVLELEREAARLKGQRSDFEAQTASTQAQIAQANLQILQQRMTFVTEVNDELGKQKAELLALSQQLSDARHTQDGKVIRATSNGIAVDLSIHTVGGVVEPGETLLEIVPIEDNLTIEAHIRPTDIDDLAAGMTAVISFPGLSHREIPRLVGRVDYVSADVTTDPRQGTNYFVVNISLSNDEKHKLANHQLLPGMPAEIFIQTGAQTPLAYLTQPLRESFHRAWREP